MLTPENTKVAIIASGHGCSGVVSALLGAGFSIASYVRDDDAMQELEQTGVMPCTSIDEALDSAEVVVTMLKGPEEVEDVYMDSGGLLEVASSGSYLIDMTTSSPRLARELYAIGAVNDLHVLDVLRLLTFDATDMSASTFVVGAEEEDCTQISSVLDAMGGQHVFLGGPGKGQLGKLVHEVAYASTLMGMIEAVVLAKQSGIDSGDALELVARYNSMPPAAVHAVASALEGDFESSPQVEGFVNDLGVALSVADAIELTLPGLEAAYQLYDLLSVIGGGGKGLQGLMLLYEDEPTCNSNGLDWTKADDDLYLGDRVDDMDEPDERGGYDYEDDIEASVHQVRPQRRRGSDESGGLLESFFSPN